MNELPRLEDVMYGFMFIFMFMFMFMECMAGEMLGEKEVKDLSSGFRRSDIEPEPQPLPFFFDLVDIFRFRVCMPSFFIVKGRFTCKHKPEVYISHVLYPK